jgi:hypothetical protein
VILCAADLLNNFTPFAAESKELTFGTPLLSAQIGVKY